MAQDSAYCARRTQPRYRLDPSSRPHVPPCRFCGKSNHRNAPSCGRRSCVGYIDTWLGDNRVRIHRNLDAWEGEVVMTTITAPSLPWDLEHCAHRGPHECSGKDGCRVDVLAADEFNATADARWSRLHKAAYQRTVRRYGSGSIVRLAYGLELQARGVIHWHVIIAFGTPLERRAGRDYVEQLAELAASYGYGWVDRKLKPGAAAASAGYIAKYLTKEAGANSLRGLVLDGRAPARPVYVHRCLTRETRVTMRNLRLKRACFMRWRQTPTCAEAEAIWRIVRLVPGARLLHETAADPTAAP